LDQAHRPSCWVAGKIPGVYPNSYGVKEVAHGEAAKPFNSSLATSIWFVLLSAWTRREQIYHFGIQVEDAQGAG
jgi:hypothetical protein